MDITETAFMLILNAGNARSSATDAERLASEYKFEEAEKMIAQAKDELNQAHQIQTDLVQAEARGEKQEFGLIMVHAQDHLTMAMLSIQYASRIIDVYKKLSALENK